MTCRIAPPDLRFFFVRYVTQDDFANIHDTLPKVEGAVIWTRTQVPTAIGNRRNLYNVLLFLHEGLLGIPIRS